MTTCLCGSKKPAAECCDPYLAGTALPPTAEALMRSRYVAYTRTDVGYLARTHAPDSPEPFDQEGTQAWASRATFKGLKIVRTEKGGEADTIGKVEFFARFREGGKSYGHHEVSEFRKNAEGRWLYHAGDGHRHDGDHEHHHHDHAPAPAVETFKRDTPKVGRNDPCPCGSGKKWKKCHGAAA